MQHGEEGAARKGHPRGGGGRDDDQPSRLALFCRDVEEVRRIRGQDEPRDHRERGEPARDDEPSCDDRAQLLELPALAQIGDVADERSR
jgi:hypothetical protein